MANGTPVIAFGRGSVPEIIEDGVTGFIVDDIERRWRRCRWHGSSIARAIRAALRAALHVERMARDYLGIYDAGSVRASSSAAGAIAAALATQAAD